MHALCVTRTVGTRPGWHRYGAEGGGGCVSRCIAWCSDASAVTWSWKERLDAADWHKRAASAHATEVGLMDVGWGKGAAVYGGGAAAA